MASTNTAKIDTVPEVLRQTHYLRDKPIHRILTKSTPNENYHTERIKTETKLFQNLAMCEAQLKSFTDEFTNSTLSGHTIMEWSDRVEKLNRAKDMILGLIQSKINEFTLEKKT